MDRTHLIGHWTDAANTRHDIGHFIGVASLEEGFKKSRRFKDPELDILYPAILDRDMKGAFSLHPGHHVDFDGSGFIWGCCRIVHLATFNFQLKNSRNILFPGNDQKGSSSKAARSEQDEAY
jgi:hypothetical protein